MNNEEREILKNEIIEQIFLKLPDIIGNLMTSQATLSKLNVKLYSEYPEFKNNKSLVAHILEEIDGDNPGLEYEEVIKKAIPIIKERMGVVNKLDVNHIPNRSELKLNYNGNI